MSTDQTKATTAIKLESPDAADRLWRETCDAQGWSDEVKIIHLEGFLRARGLFVEFAIHAQAAAAEENADAKALSYDA